MITRRRCVSRATELATQGRRLHSAASRGDVLVHEQSALDAQADEAFAASQQYMELATGSVLGRLRYRDSSPCLKAQCRGCIPHSGRVHLTPAWLLELCYAVRRGR